MTEIIETNDLTPRSKEFIQNRGILSSHAEKVGEYNRLNNWLIVFRPINPDVAKKLNEGYRGKVIFIKSKSSEFPPIGGDIPFEAELSKSFDKGNDVIYHFNQIAKDALKRKGEELKSIIDENKDIFKKNIEELKRIETTISLIKKSPDSKLEEELLTIKKELEQKINSYKSKLEEYNLNFFLDKKPKRVSIPEENDECELYCKKLNSSIYDHNIEVNENSPVFYVKKSDKKFYKIKEYNEDGSIKSLEQNDFTEDNDIFQNVEIFTYSQYKINDNGEILEDKPALTADYDQLTAGPVYMTINIDKINNDKKKLWDAIDYITGLENSKFNQENLQQIKNHLKNIESFLPAIEQNKDDNYECIRNSDDLTIEQFKPNEIKEKIESLKDILLFPVKSIEYDDIDLKFCISEREKLITYPADKYMKELKKNIEDILRIKNVELSKDDYNTIAENLQKIQEFLPEEFKKKYPQDKSEILTFIKDNIEDIKTKVNIVNIKLGLLGTCSEAITKEKIAIGEILDYGISHGLEIQHFPPESIKPRGEEFLIIDETGKVRVIDGLEGLLSHINYKKSMGIACLEVNPLWPIKRLDNGDIIYSEKEQNPIASIYSSLVGLQTLIKERRQEDFDPIGYYIYAERLYYNSNFIPYAHELKQKDMKKFEELKSKVTIDTLNDANKAYNKSLQQLDTILRSPYLEDDFLDFCSKEPINGLASYLENHEDLLKWLSSNKEIIKSFHQTCNNFEGQYDEGTFKGECVEIHIHDILDQSKLENPKDKEILKKILELGFKTNPRDPRIDKVFDEIIPNLNLLKGLEEGKKFKEKILNTKKFINNRVEKILYLLPKKSKSLPLQTSYKWRNKVKSKSTPNFINHDLFN